MEPIVYVESLNFGYGSHVVLCDFNINIFPGEFVALTGRNGTGKSTFLNLLLRRIRPDSGRILFFGVPLETFDRWEWVGYVSQVHAGATPEFPVTVEEILSLNQYRGFCRGIYSKAERKERAEEAAMKLGITDLLKSSFHELSGGQRQKVIIAKALIYEPKLLVLDEPMASLDEQSRKQVFRLLSAERERRKMAILMVTHETEECRDIVDRIDVLDGGTIVRRERC